MAAKVLLADEIVRLNKQWNGVLERVALGYLEPEQVRRRIQALIEIKIPMVRSITALKLDIDARDGLARIKVETIGDLLSKTEAEVIQAMREPGTPPTWPHLDMAIKRSLRVRAALDDLGLQLKGPRHDADALERMTHIGDDEPTSLL